MISIREFFSDDYDRETLLVPSLAVVTPAIIVGAILGFNISLVLGFTVIGIELASIVLWLMAGLVREKGKSLESQLFAGGMPTTNALRLRKNSGFEINNRRKLIQHVTGVKLLTKSREIGDPIEGDERIINSINIAKEKMRDPQKFKILRRELKSYGQWRNLVAVRWWGFIVSVLSALISMWVFFTSESVDQNLPFIAFLVALAGCLYWLCITKPARVFLAANRYKEQFFKSTELLKR